MKNFPPNTHSLYSIVIFKPTGYEGVITDVVCKIPDMHLSGVRYEIMVGQFTFRDVRHYQLTKKE